MSDWKPIVWTEGERRKGQAWGLKTIESVHTHETLRVEGERTIVEPESANYRLGG